jgi:hypothetical protein
MIGGLILMLLTSCAGAEAPDPDPTALAEPTAAPTAVPTAVPTPVPTVTQVPISLSWNQKSAMPPVWWMARFTWSAAEGRTEN